MIYKLMLSVSLFMVPHIACATQRSELPFIMAMVAEQGRLLAALYNEQSMHHNAAALHNASQLEQAKFNTKLQPAQQQHHKPFMRSKGRGGRHNFNRTRHVRGKH